jgi:hypothetical protein
MENPLLNQLEIDSDDQHVWRSERKNLISRLQNLCVSNSIKFSTGTINTGARGSKGVHFWPGDLIPDLEHWTKLNQKYRQQGFTLFVLTDNFIEIDDLECIKFHSDPTLHSIFCSFNGDCIVNKNPSKLYNCFMQRIESVRQSWFYFLYLRNLLDKGYVSFLLKQLTSYSNLTGAELFDYIHFTFKLDAVPGFSEAYQQLRPQVPYRNFVENKNLPFYIQDSKYSLVLETYATDPATDRWSVNEKAIRALCFSGIPLLFLQARAVEKLKSIGFQIDYHDQIDTLPWVDKQRALLDIIENDAIDFNCKYNYNKAMYNRSIGLAAKQKFQNINYFDEFITKVLEH